MSPPTMTLPRSGADNDQLFGSGMTLTHDVLADAGQHVFHVAFEHVDLARVDVLGGEAH